MLHKITKSQRKLCEHCNIRDMRQSNVVVCPFIMCCVKKKRNSNGTKKVLQ